MTGSHSSMILATILSVLVGLIIWFIVRQQKRRFWMPILRVIPRELSALPKLRWILPPLWTLLCFALASTSLLIYSLQLADSLVKKDDIDLLRTHIFFDLSPSNSLGLSISQYANEAQNLLGALNGKARLSFNTSTSSSIYSDADTARVATIIQGEGFHRAGVKIGASIELLLKQVTDIEQLIIVSDRDWSSWEDFNWRYLEKKIQISWYPMPGQQPAQDNVFIDEVKQKINSSGSLNSIWQLSLRRTGQGKALQGKIRAEFEGHQVLAQEWHFDQMTKNLELELNVPLNGASQKNNESAHLLWSLSPIGPDDLLIDNDYRSWPQIRGRDALLVARPRGEMFLDDSVFHLKSSLEVLGYQVQRVDQISEFEAQSKAPQLIVAEASPTAQLGTFCPIFATQRSSQEKGREDLSVWLVPGQELSDYGELCYCFAALVQAPKPLAARPAYCENIEHRDQYVGILQSIGAMQLGGAIDSPLASVAMSIRNKELGMRVLGFTSPLNPMRAGQLSYGQLPLLLRAVFQATGVKIGKNQEKQQDWPRIDDISAAYDLPNLALSNVPMRESLGRQASLDQLPAQLSLGAKGLVRQQSMGGSENDARPWIYLCLLLVVLSLWLEIIGFGLSRIFRRHRWVLRWFVIIISLCLAPDKAESGVKLNLLGYGSVPKLNSLMKEVAGRTSIELEEQTVGQLNFHRDILREPWLWVARPEILEALEARDFSELTAWLQRGGFLVVENHSGSEKLKRTILEAAPTGSWKPIPPDHELMRSFHLLASLPQCQNQVWEGFHFDQRIALVLIPGEFLRYTLDERSPGHCFDKYSHEQAVRVFINLLMVSLATDYKKDQIHLPEILKRLR